MENDIPETIRLLGRIIHEVIEGDYLRSLDGPPVISHDEDRTYVDLPQAGVSLVVLADGTVSSVQHYANGYQGHVQFQGVLPCGLSFEDSQQKVRKKLGRPTTSGGGRMLPVIGKAPAWDRYDESALSLHIQYATDSKTIDLITAMIPEGIPS
jgi:hypothetical protein